MKYIVILFITCAFTNAFAFNCGPPGNQCSAEFKSCTMSVNNVQRHFCLHKPQLPPNSNMPIVMAFHGHTGTGKVMANIWKKHTEQGMVIVAPTALSSTVTPAGQCKTTDTRWRHLNHLIPQWSDLTTGSPPAACPGTNIDDLFFVSKLVDQLEKENICNNSQEVGGCKYFAAGFSNGAGMVYQLFLTHPYADRFSGFAAVSNKVSISKRYAYEINPTLSYTAPSGQTISINKDTKKPIIYLQGTNDKVNAPTANINGYVDNVGNCGQILSAMDATKCWMDNATYNNSLFGNAQSKKLIMFTPRYITKQFLVEHNNATERAIQSLYPDVGHGNGSGADQTAVIRQDYIKKQSQNSEPVTMVTILDGTHNWPGKSGDYPPCINNSCNIDATEVILQFWRANAGFISKWK